MFFYRKKIRSLFKLGSWKFSCDVNVIEKEIKKKEPLTYALKLILKKITDFNSKKTEIFQNIFMILLI